MRSRSVAPALILLVRSREEAEDSGDLRSSWTAAAWDVIVRSVTSGSIDGNGGDSYSEHATVIGCYAVLVLTPQ
jgi:hypothetical protein